MKLSSSVIEEFWYLQPDNEGGSSLAASARMAALLSRITKLRPFPQVVQRLLAILEQPDFDVAVVTKLIEEDPALTVNVLRVANSALLTTKPSKDVAQAVVRLGSRALREMVYSGAVTGLIEDVTGNSRRVRDHCAITAAIAQYLRQRYRIRGAEEAFICGLMHDLGKLMLLQTDYVHYVELMDESDMYKSDVIHKAERRKLGFDHAVLGGHLLVGWHIPSPIPQIVAWHHQPSRSSSSLMAVVRLADILEPIVSKGRRPAKRTRERLSKNEECNQLAIDIEELFDDWEGMIETRARALELFGGEGIPKTVKMDNRHQRGR